MPNDREFDRPSRYRISVRGHLDDSWSDWFDGLVITQDDNMTVLSGTIADQAALYGLLIKLRDLNLILISTSREETAAFVKE
jgi:shikimate kinase